MISAVTCIIVVIYIIVSIKYKISDGNQKPISDAVKALSGNWKEKDGKLCAIIKGDSFVFYEAADNDHSVFRFTIQFANIARFHESSDTLGGPVMLRSNDGDIYYILSILNQNYFILEKDGQRKGEVLLGRTVLFMSRQTGEVQPIGRQNER